MTPLELDPLDAAIVIRSDGTIEGYISDIEDEHGMVPEQSVTAAVLLMVANSPELLEELRERLLPKDTAN